MYSVAWLRVVERRAKLQRLLADHAEAGFDVGEGGVGVVFVFTSVAQLVARAIPPVLSA
jgi:hypothetical protein